MKSPLKDKPLRNPGQSLDNQIEEIILDEVLIYMIFAMSMVCYAFTEWIRWYTNAKPSPLLYTCIAIMALCYSAFKIYRARSKVKSLKQGRDGEKAVGQYLDGLRELGMRIFHVIPAKGFNLDHVVIGQHGIYVIETKTYSKPDVGKAMIKFDGESILYNGGHQTTKPISQVKAAGKWFADLLLESTGHLFVIKPVVLFPGWYIETTSDAKSSDVWVLNPKALPTYIENSQDRLQPEDVKLASFHLSRYIRTFDDR